MSRMTKTQLEEIVEILEHPSYYVFQRKDKDSRTGCYRQSVIVVFGVPREKARRKLGDVGIRCQEVLKNPDTFGVLVASHRGRASIGAPENKQAAERAAASKRRIKRWLEEIYVE